MRTRDECGEFISYCLNILGIRVWRSHCQLVARSNGGRWVALGPPRPLPIAIPEDPTGIASDPLALTAYQYNRERPGSDLCAVLAMSKPFDLAIAEDTQIRD